MQTKMTGRDWKYPLLPARASGMLGVGDAHKHQIYWQDYGNPRGEPVMFLHGGPGGACSPDLSRFFDPARYRVVLFDQRGCGKSKPSASDPDPAPALADNTTPNLIRDIISLRKELNIKGKMHVFGGSWGSTLALAYAIQHPETVQSLILRGIFQCRRKDLDYFYQGNAATYARRPYDTTLSGAYLFFPEAWKQFVEVIPPAKRGDMVKAYNEIFTKTPQSKADHDALTKAACAWSIWEGVTSYLGQDTKDLGKFAEPEFAKAFARIENHYFMNGGFLGGSGPRNRANSYILDNLYKLKDIPVTIVQGYIDQVCPRFQADELIAGLKKAGVGPIDYRLTVAGHSAQERENCLALTAVMDSLPPADRSGRAKAAATARRQKPKRSIG